MSFKLLAEVSLGDTSIVYKCENNTFSPSGLNEITKYLFEYNI